MKRYPLLLAQANDAEQMSFFFALVNVRLPPDSLVYHYCPYIPGDNIPQASVP